MTAKDDNQALIDWLGWKRRQPIQVSLPVISDSRASHPRDQLVFEFDEDLVTVHLDRDIPYTVSVSREDFEKLLLFTKRDELNKDRS